MESSNGAISIDMTLGNCRKQILLIFGLHIT